MIKRYCVDCGVKCKLEQGEGKWNRCAKCLEEIKSTGKRMPRHYYKMLLVSLCLFCFFSIIFFVAIGFFKIGKYEILGLNIALFSTIFIYLRQCMIICPHCKKWCHKSDKYCFNCGILLY